MAGGCGEDDSSHITSQRCIELLLFVCEMGLGFTVKCQHHACNIIPASCILYVHVK